jgi:hypothetical protein
MFDIHLGAIGIRPLGVYPYIDVVRVWLTDPLSEARLRNLRLMCGDLLVWRIGEPKPISIDRIPRGRPPRWRSAKFDPTLKQWIGLCQPTRAAILSMARRSPHLNYVEFALDWIFPNKEAQKAAYETADRFHVKRHHNRQQVRYVGEGDVSRTRYTGPRSAPNVLATYQDRASKVTGELCCVHFCWRVKGSEALRRTGVKNLEDVLRVDPHMFWLNRLLLYGVISPERLGRMYLQHHTGSRRRGPWVQKISKSGLTYDFDFRTGGLLKRIYPTTQELIDALPPKLRGHFRRRCLFPVDVSHLLPPWGTSPTPH